MVGYGSSDARCGSSDRQVRGCGYVRAVMINGSRLWASILACLGAAVTTSCHSTATTNQSGTKRLGTIDASAPVSETIAGKATAGSSGSPSDAGGPLDAEQSSAWPVLRPGIWTVTTEVRPSRGKPRRATERSEQCHDPTWLLKGYWGAGLSKKPAANFARARKLRER